MTDMDQEIAAQLKKLEWFDEVPDEMLAVLAKKVHKRTLGANETMFNKGEEGDSLFIIHSGWVKVVTTDAQGGEVVLNQVGDGEIIGEMALLDNEPRSAGVVTLKETTVLELKRKDFMDILVTQPDMAMDVIRNFSARLRYSTHYIEMITSLSKRVAKGDYSFIGDSQPIQMGDKVLSDQDKIGKLLSEFFMMVQGVKDREDELKKQVEKLTFEIDESKRKQEFEEITGTEFYANLKKQAKALRAKRKDNK